MKILEWNRLSAPVVSVIALLVYATVAAQQPRPTFRAGVELIEVDVVVTGSDGQAVPDLQDDEFSVFENGARREIVSISRIASPNAQPGETRASDVSSNTGLDEGGLFFLILDDSNSLRESTAAIRNTAAHLVGRLHPSDQIAMLWVSQTAKGSREFTANHATILRALDGFRAQTATIERIAGRMRIPEQNPLAPVGELDRVAPPPVVGDSFGVSDNLKGEFDRLRPLAIIHDVSQYLSAVPGRRKSVIYVGEGLAGLGVNAARVQPHADIDLRRAIVAARQANVSVYLLDPSRPGRAGAEGLFENDRSQAPAVADATGGLATASLALDAQIDQIVDGARRYYILRYYADPPSAPSLARRMASLTNPWSEFRAIEVRIARPGVTWRSRRGYWPSAVTAPPAKTDLTPSSLGQILPNSDLALTAFAAPLRGTGRLPQVALAIGVDNVALSSGGNGQVEERARLGIVAVEPGRGSRLVENVELRLALGPSLMAPPRGYVVYSLVSLPAGNYQLRIGVERDGAGGSVYHDVDIPDYSSLPLALSGLVLSQTAGHPPVPVARANLLRDLLPVRPSLSREFDRSAKVDAFARVYRWQKARWQAASVSAAIRSADTGLQLWSSNRSIVFDQHGAADFRCELPLTTLAAGSYYLSIAADAEGHSAQQRIAFRLTDPAR